MRGQANKCRLRTGGGFSLIELVAVLAVLAILAGIAYPSYREAMRKAKRAEGRAALFQLMQQQERYYARHNSYIAFSSSSADDEERSFKWYSGARAESSAYEIKAEACRDDTIRDCVQLTAMPGTRRVDSRYEDSTCGELTLTSTGIKHAARPDCWK